MSGYTKLFGSILDSSIWRESKETRLVWITMLAMADRDGKVDASIPGLADRAKVTVEECQLALETFKSPDQWSRTKDNDGRRIQDVEGGWLLLNHAAYREKMSIEERRAYWAMKQREARARKNSLGRKMRRLESETMQRAAGEANGSQ